MTPAENKQTVEAARESWEARCHFCGGPSFPWLTDDETWVKVQPLLGQQQACFECFGAAWFALGLNDGEPFRVALRDLVVQADRAAELEAALRDARRDFENFGRWAAHPAEPTDRDWAYVITEAGKSAARIDSALDGQGADAV